MINVNRWLEISIFTLRNDVKIGEFELKKGIQQLVRKDRLYYFSMLGEQPYAVIPIENNKNVVRAIFSKSLTYHYQE